MNLRTLFAIGFCLLLAACGSSEPTFVESELDQAFYPANTNAERLLRLFEVQALLVRFAADAGGSLADRKSVALLNAGASDTLSRLVACLRVGSVNISRPDVSSNTDLLDKVMDASRNADPNDVVAPSSAYCSFFNSRELDYEVTLFNMLRTVARSDPTISLLQQTIHFNVLSFNKIVANFGQIVGRAIEDELVVQAFKEDAIELRDLLYQQPEASGPDQILDACVDTNKPCNNEVEAAPPVLVWHFLEVEAFIASSCLALDNDVASIQKGPTCSSNMPFHFQALNLNKPSPFGRIGGVSPIYAGVRKVSAAGPDRLGNPPNTVPNNAANAVEESISKPQLLSIESAVLCLRPSRGSYDASVRAALWVYFQQYGAPEGSTKDTIEVKDEKEQLVKAAGRITICPSGAANTFEFNQFYSNGVVDIVSVKNFQSWLNSADPEGQKLELSGELDEKTRAKINSVRAAMEIFEHDASGKVRQSLNNQVTKDIYRKCLSAHLCVLE